MALCVIIKASILFLPIYVIAEYKSCYAYIEGGNMPASKDKGIGGQMWLAFFSSVVRCMMKESFFSYETTAFGFLKGAFKQSSTVINFYY